MFGSKKTINKLIVVILGLGVFTLAVYLIGAFGSYYGLWGNVLGL